MELLHISSSTFDSAFPHITKKIHYILCFIYQCIYFINKVYTFMSTTCAYILKRANTHNTAISLVRSHELCMPLFSFSSRKAGTASFHRSSFWTYEVACFLLVSPFIHTISYWISFYLSLYTLPIRVFAWLGRFIEFAAGQLAASKLRIYTGFSKTYLSYTTACYMCAYRSTYNTVR